MIGGRDIFVEGLFMGLRQLATPSCLALKSPPASSKMGNGETVPPSPGSESEPNFKLKNANCKFQICILQSTISNLQFEGKVVLVVFEIWILDLNGGWGPIPDSQFPIPVVEPTTYHSPPIT